jgi:hypothetical protein
MSREQHLAWAKKRALDYVDRGELANALASMASDLRKHPQLKDHAAIELQIMQQLGGFLKTQTQVREWINGFN